MSQPNKMLKPIAAVAVLALILLLVLNWWGDYRSPEPTEVEESTATVDATATPEGGDSTQTAAEGEDAAAAEAQGTVIVLVNGLNFRTQPEGSAELIRGLAQDTELVLISEADGWYKVKDSDGTVGYVSASEQYTRREP